MQLALNRYSASEIDSSCKMGGKGRSKTGTRKAGSKAMSPGGVVDAKEKFR